MSSLWPLLPFLSQNETTTIGVLAAGADFGALLPELDASASKIKHLRFSGVKPFESPSVALHQTLGHRGLLHSLVGIGVFCLMAIPLADGAPSDFH